MKYYQKITLFFFLIWGFVAIQRIVIAIIMPAIQSDLKLTYTQVGAIISITGFIWAFGTVLWAGIGDHYGRRPVIVACSIIASVFSWVTGLLSTFVQLMTVRGLLGFFEGGPWGPMNATISEEAPPEKRGKLLGSMPGGFMLIGVGLGPLIAVWLLGYFKSWRMVFYLISIPCAIFAIILAFIMRETPSMVDTIQKRKDGQKREVLDQYGEKVRMVDVLKYKNVLISVLVSVPVMAWLWISTGFSPLWLTKVHHIGMNKMGLIMSAVGLGGFFGAPVMGAISDRIGRKKAMILSGFLCFLSALLIILMPTGTSPIIFSIFYFFWGFFGIGHFPLYLGSLPIESVPYQYAATAVGIPTAVGEILGAGVMPGIGGSLADKFNLYAPMWMACVAGLVIVALSLLYVETAPKILEGMEKKLTRDDYLLKPFRGKKPPLETT